MYEPSKLRTPAHQLFTRCRSPSRIDDRGEAALPVRSPPSPARGKAEAAPVLDSSGLLPV